MPGRNCKVKNTKIVKKSGLSKNQPESDVIFPRQTIHVHYKMTNIDTNGITLQCLEGIVKKKIQEIVKNRDFPKTSVFGKNSYTPGENCVSRKCLIYKELAVFAKSISQNQSGFGKCSIFRVFDPGLH
jgi:hypothetical protein